MSVVFFVELGEMVLMPVRRARSLVIRPSARWEDLVQIARSQMLHLENEVRVDERCAQDELVQSRSSRPIWNDLAFLLRSCCRVVVVVIVVVVVVAFSRIRHSVAGRRFGRGKRNELDCPCGKIASSRFLRG